MTAKHFLFYSIICFFLFFVLGYYISYIVESNDIKKVKTTQWVLPNTQGFNYEEQLSYIKEKKLFGATPKTDIPPVKEEKKEKVADKWIASGILFKEGDYRLIMTNQTTGKIYEFKKGEEMPDNFIVEKIEKDGYVIEKNGQKTRIDLYPNNHIKVQ